jgi:hypothetical protein
MPTFEAAVTSTDLAALGAWFHDRGAGLARPGTSTRAELLIELGQRLGREPAGDISGLAFWLRQSNIRALATRAAGAGGPVRSMARGTVAHFLPGNTPLLGVYTWSLSFLCGNRTVLRLSSRASDQELDVYSKVLDLLAEQGAAASTRIVVCESDGEEMRAVSAAADVRLIWGSDATVEAVRRLPASAACHDVTFGDRRSLAAIGARSLLNLSDGQVRSLATRFVGDVAWSLHQACSAPRSLVWVGDAPTCEAAAQRFAAALETIENPLVSNLPAGGHLDRLTWAQLSVAEGRAHRYLTLRNGLTLLDGSTVERPDGTWPAGLVGQSTVSSLAEVAAALSANSQTLALFGFTKADVDALFDQVEPGTLRRLVAIGDSHRFGPVWDGYDLIDVLTSKVVVAVPGAASP